MKYTVKSMNEVIEKTSLKWTKPKVDIPLVRDLMTKNPITISEDDTLKTFGNLMNWKSIRHLPVVDDNQRLIGLVTQRDFLTLSVSKLAHLSKLEADQIYDGVKIGQIMGRKVTSVTPETPLSDAAEIMFKNKFGCLPVVNDHRLVGIITESDFVKFFVEK